MVSEVYSRVYIGGGQINDYIALYCSYLEWPDVYDVYNTAPKNLKTIGKEIECEKASFEAIPENSERWSRSDVTRPSSREWRH